MRTSVNFLFIVFCHFCLCERRVMGNVGEMGAMSSQGMTESEHLTMHTYDRQTIGRAKNGETPTSQHSVNQTHSWYPILPKICPRRPLPFSPHRASTRSSSFLSRPAIITPSRLSQSIRGVVCRMTSLAAPSRETVVAERRRPR